MTPSELAQRYFECVRAADIDGFVALFAEDAVMVMPNGRECVGIAQIRESETAVFAHGAPQPTPLAIIANEHGVAAEVRVDLPDGSARYAANIYHLAPDGRIQRLSVYMRG
jgi:uncharacterized protein (TIGR02246 family)